MGYKDSVSRFDALAQRYKAATKMVHEMQLADQYEQRRKYEEQQRELERLRKEALDKQKRMGTWKGVGTLVGAGAGGVAAAMTGNPMAIPMGAQLGGLAGGIGGGFDTGEWNQALDSNQITAAATNIGNFAAGQQKANSAPASGSPEMSGTAQQGLRANASPMTPDPATLYNPSRPAGPDAGVNQWDTQYDPWRVDTGFRLG